MSAGGDNRAASAERRRGHLRAYVGELFFDDTLSISAGVGELVAEILRTIRRDVEDLSVEFAPMAAAAAAKRLAERFMGRRR